MFKSNIMGCSHTKTTEVKKHFAEIAYVRHVSYRPDHVIANVGRCGVRIDDDVPGYSDIHSGRSLVIYYDYPYIVTRVSDAMPIIHVAGIVMNVVGNELFMIDKVIECSVPELTDFLKNQRLLCDKKVAGYCMFRCTYAVDGLVCEQL